MEKAKMSREKEYKAKKEKMGSYKVSNVRECKVSKVMSRVRGCLMGSRVREMVTESGVGERKNKATMSRVRGCMMGPRVREMVTETGVRERRKYKARVREFVSMVGVMTASMRECMARYCTEVSRMRCEGRWAAESTG